MTHFNSTGWLEFQGVEHRGVLFPSGSFENFNGPNVVRDGNGNGVLDTGDYFEISDLPYSGFAFEIEGREYAIFSDIYSNLFFVPYDRTVHDLSVHHGADATSFPLLALGNTANVSNCFLTGTEIATPSGPRAIETLTPGDRVTLATGGSAPVRWVARQTVRPLARNVPIPEGRLPICIRAGALGPNTPSCDLYVSGDHGMVLGEFLINANVLINGHSICAVPLAELPEVFTYWHVELDTHAEIIANGAVTESFVDYMGREAFDNFEEHKEPVGSDRVIPEMTRLRISSPRMLPPVLEHLVFGADAAA